jgi:diketogulonate reductase-like aldo/keto reductase
MMKHVEWQDGSRSPALGLGTWHMGESSRSRAKEVAAIRLAIEVGYRVIDTAEMYGEGGAEQVVGQAVEEAIRAGTVRRDELFIVSKVYPHNASRQGVPAAAARSLERLRLDHIDLYLLHWPGSHPLRETVAAFEALQSDGRIRHWGVSNFDVAGMTALERVPGGKACATNQVYYSIGQRAIEFELLPWLQAHRMPLMAYSPLDQGALDETGPLRALAERLGVSAAQIALARLLAQPGVMAIPKAVQETHLRANLAAADVHLSAADIAEIDRMYPPPTRKMPLPMI